jgi:hypothetical protein
MLPAPRDPRAPEAVPPEPPPDPPPLELVLTELLRSAGAQAVHAVDGERRVLAEVGLADGDDVSALVQLAGAAAALGRGRGEWVEDVVVTLGRTVHVLRECDGVVLHARLDPSRGDVGAVRRGLGADGVRRATAAAGRAAATEGVRSDGARRDGARPEAARSGRGRHAAAAPAPAGVGPDPTGGHPRPARGDTPRPGAVEKPRPRPAAAAPPAAPPATRAAPPATRGPAAPAGGRNAWPYTLPDPANRQPVRPAERADQGGGQRAAGPGGAHATQSTAPAMPRVAPQPVPPRPLPSTTGPRRPPPARPVSQPMPVPVPRPAPPPQVSQPVPLQVSQPLPRPVPQPRSARPEPPPGPLPRPPTRSGPDVREPALLAVDAGPPITASGALAVLALPPAAVLPRRRRAAPAPPAPAPSPRALVTPAVLRQPWASDIDTMRRVLALLHRLTERPAGNRLAPGH